MPYDLARGTELEGGFLKISSKEREEKAVGSLCDPDFAKALLHETVDLLLDGDSAPAKLILRDLVNATV